MPAADQPVTWKSQPGHLPDALWREIGRSRELTPVLVQRYHGRHDSAVDTWHDGWEMILVFRGQGVLEAQDTIALGASMACLVPPRMPHRERSARPMDVLWIGLAGTWLDALPKRLLRIGAARSLLPLAHQLWLCAERRPAPVGVELDGLARCLVGRALRLVSESDAAGPLTLDRSIEFLHRHHARDLVVADLAARVGCSERHFNRMFTQHTGLAPLRYLRRIRIENARKLMAYRQLSLDEIGALVGYRDPAYFSRVFRLETGSPPSAFR
ncbi:MAG: helix-turn-helix domain-containing protein [Planctomycetes bacterium]|nr:helix-turn-helix domain-containing protein [Planctomycetota bacterium]